jgi:hypothetical protein
MTNEEKKPCPWGGCNGNAKPGEKCPLCGTKIPKPREWPDPDSGTGQIPPYE